MNTPAAMEVRLPSFEAQSLALFRSLRRPLSISPSALGSTPDLGNNGSTEDQHGAPAQIED
jgi:hypothetical protein